MRVPTLSLYLKVALIGLICLLSYPTFSAEKQIQVVTENWYPYNYQSENGDIIGDATERVKAILDASGLDYTINLYPWTRAMSLAQAQENVLIYTILKMPERQEHFHWICPIAAKRVHHAFKLASNKKVLIKSESDIPHYSTAVTRGTFLHQFMLELGMVEGKNLQVTADDSINITLLLAGRVDLLFEFEDSIADKMREIGVSSSKLEHAMHLSEVHYPEYCMALSKQTSQQIVNQIMQAHYVISTKP